jgi:RimJ/RimL family protein N-acetyltransferase
MQQKKSTVTIDGSTILIQPLNGKENIREFQRFINSITKEGSYLLLNRPLTLNEEKTWLENQYKTNKKGEQIYLKATVNDQLIGVVHAQRGIFRNQGNATLGIAVAKQWRGKSLGRLLLQEIIARVEHTWHPKNIYLHVVVANKTAHALYTSLGFRPIARLPQWFEYNGKYLDELVLLLDKKYYTQQKRKKNYDVCVGNKKI